MESQIIFQQTVPLCHVFFWVASIHWFITSKKTASKTWLAFGKLADPVFFGKSW